MVKREKEKIKILAKFLDKSVVKKYKSGNIKTIDDILDLPALAFNFLREVDIKLIRNLYNISQIKEFRYLDQDAPFEIISKSDRKKRAQIKELLTIDTDIEEKIKKAIIISSIAYRIKNESVIIERKEQKVIVVGLGNAGKTTILSKFGGQLGIKDLARLRPTKGIERKEVKSSNLKLTIWDFGGQEEYRAKYILEPEKYFLGIDLIIYVIDIQEPDLYKESIEYFGKILNIINRLEEYPFILIFLHKFDPDLKEDNEILLNVEYLKDEIKNLFDDKKTLDYEIYLSSIYSMIAKEPKFAQYLKHTMEKTATLENPSISKIEGIASILETTLNGVIRLSESVMTQFNEVNKRLDALETKKKKIPRQMSTGPIPLYSTTKPQTQDVQDPQKIKAVKSPNARAAVLEELQFLFDKRSKLK